MAELEYMQRIAWARLLEATLQVRRSLASSLLPVMLQVRSILPVTSWRLSVLPKQ